MLDAILHFFHSLYNAEGLKELIRSGGAPLICAIVFVETGFFVGFFLPGDSLLVTAGIFSAAGVIPLKWLLLPVMLCAIVGDQIGYWIGRSTGAALYRREDSFFFRRKNMAAGQLSSPGLFPSFEPSVRPSPARHRCLTSATWFLTFLVGSFGSAP